MYFYDSGIAKSIPLAFCRHIIGEKSKEAVIRSRKGSWHVKIGKCRKGQLYFEEGWSKFVQEHDLNIGEFLVFEHKGHLHFDVLVYDSSSCEKEFPVDSGNDKKRAAVHVEENSKKHCRLDKQKSPVKEIAPYSPIRPHFRTTIKASHGVPGAPYLTIPAEFVKSNNLSQHQSLALRDPSGKLWDVKLKLWRSCNATRQILFHGWYEFYRGNNLKIGDLCIFELNDGTTKSGSIVLDVKIIQQPII